MAFSTWSGAEWRLLRISILSALALVVLPAGAQLNQCAGTMAPTELDARIDQLIQKMTVKERVSQLKDHAPAIPRLGIPAYNWWNEGLHGIARNGYATVFPQAIGLAATADAELMERVGEVVSTEARAKFNPHLQSDSAQYAGVTIWSPNINIFRDPRWGRGQETYGEDPFLTGTLASAFIRGIQGDPGSFYRRADATAKHFAVHSGPESTRDSFNSVVTAHDLNDTYLPAFRRQLGEAHAAAVMCSYNAINGTPACANDALLNNRTRGQWGFTGYVVSDCDAVGNITGYQHFTADNEHGAAAALKAGVDLNCGWTYPHLEGALEKGLVSETDIDRALHRLLLSRLRLGMLQPATCSPYYSIAATEVDTPAHRSLALRAAEESIVLLRNDRTLDGKPLLPLDVHGKRIAVIGPTAELLSVIEANYHGTAYRGASILEGLRHALPSGAKLLYAQGSSLATGITIPIPSSAFSSGGLSAEYFHNAELKGSPAIARRDPQVDFDWDHVSPASEDSAAITSGEPYSVRWTGELKPPAPGAYRLRVRAERNWGSKWNDAYRLWIDGKLVLEDSGKPPAEGAQGAPDSATFQWADVSAHPIRLESLHIGEDQGIHLEWEAPEEAQRAEALEVARQADVILALVGISPDLEGEALSIKIPGFNGGDRDDLRLPEVQRNLLQSLASLNKPMILGVTSGSPVAMGSVLESIHSPAAQLQLWYPGEEGGQALAHILTGAVSPSGRMPLTVYRSAEDLPPFTDYSMAQRGYRYLPASMKVEYRFGDGLGYSTFEYGAPRLSASRLSAGQPLGVETKVRNAGTREADEVVELYLVPPSGEGAPRMTLQGVQRIHLKAGQSSTVRFALTPRQMSVVDKDGHRILNPGIYRVAVSGHQPDDPAKGGESFEVVGSMQEFSESIR